MSLFDTRRTHLALATAGLLAFGAWRRRNLSDRAGDPGHTLDSDVKVLSSESADT